MSVTRNTRAVRLSLSDSLVEETEQLARRLRMDLDLLTEKALRAYVAQWSEIERELSEPIDASTPSSMSLAQVNEMIHQARQLDAEPKAA